MSLFWGLLITSLGILGIVPIVILRKFGTKINAEIISYEHIHRDYFNKRCRVSYSIDEKTYYNWVIVKNSELSCDKKEIEIIILRKYPKIAMGCNKPNILYILIFLILILLGVISIIKNICNLIE